MTTDIYRVPPVLDGAKPLGPAASQVPQVTREQWCNEHVVAFTHWKSKEDLANEWAQAGAEANPGIVFQAIVGRQLITHECAKGADHEC